MKNFEETQFAQFMASPAGRITRIVAGVGLMILGASQTSTKSKAFAARKSKRLLNTS